MPEFWSQLTWFHSLFKIALAWAQNELRIPLSHSQIIIVTLTGRGNDENQ
jgi:hypothetical protein